MSEPEYIICLNCDTPVYVFDWDGDKVTAVICTTCGADDPEEFVTDAEYDEQTGE